MELKKVIQVNSDESKLVEVEIINIKEKEFKTGAKGFEVIYQDMEDNKYTENFVTTKKDGTDNLSAIRALKNKIRAFNYDIDHKTSDMILINIIMTDDGWKFKI